MIKLNHNNCMYQDVGKLILYCKKRLKVYLKFVRVLSPSRPFQALTVCIKFWLIIDGRESKS